MSYFFLMFILNEILILGPKAFNRNAFLNECDETPFKKGDSVCIVDCEISEYRNSDVLDELLPKEKKIRTLFENVNRRGIVTKISFKKFKRFKGKLSLKTAKVTVRFSGELFVEVGNPRFIRKVN